MKEIITKQIAEICFSLISPEAIKKLAVAKIVTPELYDMEGYPVDGGLMDLRLGAIDPGVRCRTCGESMNRCPGHFGYIELARPVIHVKFVPLIELCLKACCEKCGRLLLSEKDRARFSPEKIKKAKTAKQCPFCGAKQEKIKVEKPTTFFAGKKRLFPNEIRERLVRIPDEDLLLLGIDPKTARPEWAILTVLLVPPVTTRPSITLETGERSEDSLTHKLGDILRANQRLLENLNAGAPGVIIEEVWDLLQHHVTTFFDNTLPQIPPARHRSGQPLKTLTERIKGKEGRIRHNLAGKRVNFSSRTVISPDPWIKLNEVGIPVEIARVLTVPERVTSTNISYMKELISKGDSWPGAAYLIKPDGRKYKITEELKKQLIDELEVGCIVERHLRDGDIVLFNRHPSLHRLSLMAHYARILPGHTFRLHPGTTHPYNADYDGDEMNVHVPQDEEARAEAKVLMDVNKHLTTAKDGSNVLGCKQDAITGLYLLSRSQMPRAEAIQLLVEIGLDTEKIKLPKTKQVSGLDIFSCLLPPINFGCKTKACLGKDCKWFNACKQESCPVNAYFKVVKGKVISGVIDKAVVGIETDSLIKELDKAVGRNAAMEIIDRIFKLGTLYLAKRGFSICLADVEASKKVKEETDRIIKDAERKVNELIEAYQKNKLELLPGKTAAETREIKIIKVLNDIRNRVEGVVKKEISLDNAANLMQASGSVGSILFITQMSAVVGQQVLWGKRIEHGYTKRTLSFFKQNDLSPAARGFIYSNFLKGLKPAEFFFAAITGRDSLTDTGLRTRKSGYLYRRIANTLQDVRVEYDGTVRDANGTIIQFQWGVDSIDPALQHLQKSITPGEAIGLVTAQSFGEPATQMTLNVFHFAGVSEMAISTGLPRLIEILDARKEPSTPSMQIYLESAYNNEKSAKRIAELIKEITLQEVASSFEINWAERKIRIGIDPSKAKELKVSQQEVSDALKQFPGKKFKLYSAQNAITLSFDEKTNFTDIYLTKEKLKQYRIKGIAGIKQILIEKKGNNFVIITAGSNLKEVFKIRGVDKTRTISNNIHEVNEVLGIEAARQVIINEIKHMMEQHGIHIDDRHIELVADMMCLTGEVKGTVRSGIIADKNSVIARASFETPIRHFVDAAITNTSDRLVSVIENIVLNQPVPVGTGLPCLLYTSPSPRD